LNLRKPLTSFISPAGALLLWSCGGGGSSICDKAVQANATLTAAASSCPLLTNTGGGSYSKASCEIAVIHCSSSVQQSMSSTFDCISKISRCTPGQEGQFIGAILSCALSAGNISQACTDALNAATRGDGG